MIDKLRLNTKLFSYGGVIGRRDFVLNYLYLALIYIAFSLPFTYWALFNMNSSAQAFDMNNLFLSSPLLTKIFLILGMLIVIVPHVFNVFKRVNDIVGKENLFVNIIASLIFIMTLFSILIPFPFSIIFSFLFFILFLVLSIVKGKITSRYPYDVTKLFNWGAFFGTWIWGLMNKSYIPLFMLILFFTPFNFLFALICGFKGNEWAFKNGKFKDVKKFNKKQEKQTLFWSVFSIVFIPIIFIVASFVIGLIITSAFVSSPNAKENLAKMEQSLNTMAKSQFISYELSDYENKFYIDENKWKYASFDNKKSYLDIAANLAVSEKKAKYNSSEALQPQVYYDENGQRRVHVPRRKYISKTDELNITKIYGYSTGQLLAEFHFDSSVFEGNPSVTQIMKETMNAYKFYNVNE